MSANDFSSGTKPPSATNSAWVRLATYFSGGGTPAEREATRQWIQADPARAAMVESLRQAWAMAGESPVATRGAQLDLPAAWASVARQAGLAMSTDVELAARERVIRDDGAPASRRVFSSSARLPRLEGTHGGVTRRPSRMVWGVAAAAVAVAAIGVGLRSHSHATSGRTAVRAYATAAGQQAAITLTDGSRVTLGPASRLHVEEPFGGTARRVTLVGEAYFDVAASAESPFVVHTGAVTTRVLGTRFDVRHYPTDSVVQVAVLVGKVSAGGRRTPLILTAGTVGRVTDTTATGTVVSDISTYADWTTGRLVFNDASAATMLAAVGRWYGYEFRLADSTLAGRRFKAVFNIAAREKTLAAPAALLNVTMTVNGSTITLHPKTMSRGAAVPPRRWDIDPVSPSREVGK